MMSSSVTNWKYIYFVGIGGIGMSALARWFKANGFEVAGYDKTMTTLVGKLIEEGIPVTLEENGSVAEWLGRGLQNLVQRFESARNL